MTTRSLWADTEDGRRGQPLRILSLLQTNHRRPYNRRRNYSMTPSRPYFAWLFILCLTLFFTSVQAVYVTFDNCIDPSILNSNPLHLQWVPLWVDARFNKGPAHNLNITIYGNVSGQSVQGIYPPPNSPDWNDSKITFGKIVNVSPSNDIETTLFSKYNVLTYTPYNAPPSMFCNSTVNTSCPIAPAFLANASDPYSLPAFAVGHDFGSSYGFATLAATITVKSGDKGAPVLACVSAIITPDLGYTLSNVLGYIPVVILLLVGIATIFAAIYSPWGSVEPFKWTSNYGRDEDLLRLVTPGFGDCLQYIQFIILAGSLSLNYPGFFQPAVSQVAWSTLMFNESFVSHGNGTRNPVDGIYVTNGTYGLTRMSQLVGMTDVEDIWAGMVIWMLVIVALVVILCQIGFLLRLGLRALANNPEEDLRRKNWPFTAGNLVRIVCNYFLLPIVSLSMFQLLIAPRSPGVVTAFAVVFLVAILAFAAWILRLVFSTKPRAHLFDDLPTVLLYGPLYNTYSDDAAPFALIPILLTFIRGIAIGAVQPSGIAQLVMLAICEVILILTIHAFQPFLKVTSMNAYHTFFASVRLIVLLLSVAFVPSLGVIEAPKGWIGYVILLLHAIVLVFGFFLNSVQTIIEVSARLAGAGGEEETGAAARGGLSKVFGMRQLSRRARRTGFRHSMNSDAAILTEDGDAKSLQYGARSRSVSASSAILLNSRRTPSRLSRNLDQQSPPVSEGETPYEHSSFSFLPAAAGASKKPELSLRTGEATDPYYRPPRQKRPTGEMMTPGARSRASWIGEEGVHKHQGYSPETGDLRHSMGRPLSFSPPPQVAPSPAFLRNREDSDPGVNDPRNPNIDYAVREVDFYYGVRGPALSNLPTRKLKTGPADPVGPVSSATGWFRGLLGAKTKESSKGFEVVRSSRAPQPRFADESSPEVPQEPYVDSPQQNSEGFVPGPGQRTRSNEQDWEHDFERGHSNVIRDHDHDPVSPIDADEGVINRKRYASPTSPYRVSVTTPSTASIETGVSLGLPARIGTHGEYQYTQDEPSSDMPAVPEKSTKRLSTMEGQIQPPPLEKWPAWRQNQNTDPLQLRLPFSDEGAPSNDSNRRSLGAGSNLSFDSQTAVDRASHRRTASSTVTGLALPQMASHQTDADRRTNTGFINQYRAGDNVRPGRYYSSTYTGSAAEIVNDPPPRRSRSDMDKFEFNF